MKTKKPIIKEHPVPPVTEHPNTTLADLRQKWLFQSKDKAPPEDFPEFISKSLGILHEWHYRWSEVWRLVNPKAFRTDAEREHFLRENELKAYGLWHAMRELRVYWREAGVWDGNPYDPDDVGEVPRAGSTPKIRKEVRDDPDNLPASPAEKALLVVVKALAEYQKANRLHHDEDARLHALGLEALKVAERWSKS